MTSAPEFTRSVDRGDRIQRFLALVVIFGAACGQELKPAGTLIANVTLYDGSGGEPRVTSVRILGDMVDSVGDLRPEPDEWYIDGAGLALAPGFIDSHSHADRQLFDHREALAAVSQGVTTVVVGQDGASPYPLADFFRRLDSTPASVNLASFAGHSTLRLLVLPKDDFRRPATAAEVDSMKALLFKELDAGALGLSTGLEYEEAHAASYDEVRALALATGAEGGRYLSHIRSEDREFWPAVEEIIRVGREAGLPVQISHAKLAMRSLWGQADSLISVLNRARAEGVEITADVYPYTYWQSTLRVLLPEGNYEDRAAAAYALREVTTPADLVLSRWQPDSSYVGKTLAELARSRRVDPATLLIDLIREARAAEAAGATDVESVIGTSMTDADAQRLMAWPEAAVSSDGELAGRHPRGYGSFARVLGPWVREAKLFPLGEAIRKMTSLPARTLGLADRGVVRPHAPADLVLFDPDSVADQATLAEPAKPATGIAMVWVNGEVVFERGKVTGRYPGRVLRRLTAPP